MNVQVSCPGCGAALTFTVGSSVMKVCEHCPSLQDLLREGETTELK